MSRLLRCEEILAAASVPPGASPSRLIAYPPGMSPERPPRRRAVGGPAEGFVYDRSGETTGEPPVRMIDALESRVAIGAGLSPLQAPKGSTLQKEKMPHPRGSQPFGVRIG